MKTKHLLLITFIFALIVACFMMNDRRIELSEQTDGWDPDWREMVGEVEVIKEYSYELQYDGLWMKARQTFLKSFICGKCHDSIPNYCHHNKDFVISDIIIWSVPEIQVIEYEIMHVKSYYIKRVHDVLPLYRSCLSCHDGRWWSENCNEVNDE